eukprot:14584919-Ditylum_brightwellii.AAC.1
MDGTHTLQQLRENLPEEIDIFQGNENRGIRAQIHKKAKALHKARSDSFEKQQDHLELKAMMMVHEEDLALLNLKVAKIVKQMKNEEQSCKMYCIFKRYLKMAQKASLSHVDIPDFSKIWLSLLALMGVICRTRGKWLWIIAIATMVWIHALFDYQELFATNVPHA